MPDAPKLLLIDGNNMCHRVFWAQQNLSYKGRAVNVLYGFFKQLISLHKQYPEHFRVIAWDRGYARRLEESQKGVEAGIIPTAYKANRDRDREELESLFVQMEEVQYGLTFVRCLQVSLDGIEADDIINSYARTYQKWGWQSVIVSSDNDFYQVLGPGVSIFDAMKKEVWTEERFQLEVGFGPSLWVDSGAIQGDHCLAKGTMVPLLTGETKSVEELEEMGKFWVYSCHKNGSFVPSEAVCKKTNSHVPILKVLLDNGHWVRCTENHRFMMRDGSFKMAKYLSSGDSLMPFNVRINKGGYRDIFDNFLLRWKRIYDVVAKYCWKGNYDRCVDRSGSIERNCPVVHHLDFNKLNNHPSNLTWMTLFEHMKYHCGLNKDRWENPDYRKKMLGACSRGGRIGGRITWERHREKIIKRCAAVGRKTGAKNITKYNKSDKNKPRARANILRFLRDDCFKEKRINAAKKRANTREAKERVAIIGRISCQKLNKDHDQIEKQQFGKVRKIIEMAAKRFGIVNEGTYRACWKRGGISWKKATDKFGQEKILECINHRVISVVNDGFDDVYDLQVNGYHVFALDAGIFVHNSDNIHGVDGWGPVTTNKYISEYGDVDAIIRAIQAKEKRSKKEQVFLDSLPKLRLAKSLKKMDFIPSVPKPKVCKAYDPKELEKYFLSWGFASLLKEIVRLV